MIPDYYQVRGFDPLTGHTHVEVAVYTTEEAALKRIHRLERWDDPNWPISYTIVPVTVKGLKK